MALDKKSVEMVVETVKDFFKNLLKPDMTLDTIAEVASPRLDEIIIKHVKQGYSYSAGKFTVAIIGLSKFKLSFDLYFRDKDGKWFNRKNESPDMLLDEYLSEEAIKELQDAKEKVYDVDAPPIKE